MGKITEIKKALADYVSNKDNTKVTGLNNDGKLDAGTVSEWIDNVVNQVKEVGRIDIKKHDALSYPVNVYDLTAELTQVNQGEDVTESGKGGTFQNIGYNVTLEYVQLHIVVTNAMKAAKAWDKSFAIEDKIETMLNNAFKNKLFKLALIGRMGGATYPETDPASASARRPWSTMYGWVNMLKNAGNSGYLIPAKTGIPGRVAIGSGDAITDVMKNMVKAHNKKWLNHFGKENVFFMSAGSAFEYEQKMADTYKSLPAATTGDYVPYFGYQVNEMPFAVDYDQSDGFLIFGHPKALKLIMNVTAATYEKEHSAVKRADIIVLEVAIASAIIPEMLTIAAPAYGSDSDITDDAPLILTAPTLETLKSPSAGTLNADWNEIDGADGYKVYYKKTTDSSWTVESVSGGTTTTWSKTGLTGGDVYEVKVTAYKAQDQGTYESAYSNKRTKTITS